MYRYYQQPFPYNQDAYGNQMPANPQAMFAQMMHQMTQMMPFGGNGQDYGHFNPQYFGQKNQMYAPQGQNMYQNDPIVRAYPPYNQQNNESNGQNQNDGHEHNWN